jgi:hypothetical protein
VIVDSYEVKTIYFHVICQLSSLSSIKVQILPFVTFFNRHFSVDHFLSTFLIVRWGLVRLITATAVRVCYLCFNCLYFVKLLTRSFLQMTRIIQSDIKVKELSLGSRKKLFTFSAPSYLPNSLLKHCTRALSHSV